MESAKKLSDQQGGYYDPQRRKDDGLNWGSGSQDCKDMPQEVHWGELSN